MRSFAFTLPVEEWQRWKAALPTPSYAKQITSAEGGKMQIVYELRHRPTTSGDWYKLDRLQRSYENVINGVIFNDHVSINTDGWEATGEAFKASQLQVFPLVDQSYPAIMRWANSKKGFRRSAFTYAKRLKYERMLTYPAIMAALYALNEKLPTLERIKTRTLERLANELLDKSSQWESKLPIEALKALRSDLGRQRGDQLSIERNDRIKQISEAIKTGEFTKPSGAVNQMKLAEFLGIHRNTVRNLIPFVLMAMIVILWIRPAYALSPLFPHSESMKIWGEVA